MTVARQCPFCQLEIEGDEEERLLHVLDEHSTRLFMAAASLAEMRRLNVSFDSYRTWVETKKTGARS